MVKNIVFCRNIWGKYKVLHFEKKVSSLVLLIYVKLY
jgi:hypothetical protein